MLLIYNAASRYLRSPLEQLLQLLVLEAVPVEEVPVEAGHLPLAAHGLHAVIHGDCRGLRD